MTTKQRAELLEAAAETIESLESAKSAMSKDNALLYGAMLAIVDHYAPDDDIVPAPSIIATVADTFEVSIALAENELSDADKYHAMNEVDIMRDELRHAQHFIDKARAEARVREQQSIVSELQARHDLMSCAL